ncbi:DUF3037 domain-containing protein [Paracoccus cavernae]|uniref:DUF3037 domain-containing protein n=1 Tax=Paracoccus cavernae TaxID=1571207 RepID=UPI0035F3B501
MKRNFKFDYCLLQYEHNPWLKERLNIGVLLYSEAANFLQLETRSWDGRILQSYPNIEKASFTEDLNQIARSIKIFLRTDFKQPSLLPSLKSLPSIDQSEYGALRIAQLLSPDMDTSYRWEAGGVGVCSSPSEKLDQLFHRFVTSYDKPRNDTNRSDSQVWSTFSSKLSERKLDRFIEVDKTVTTDLGPVKFHAGYRNGALHVIQPLSFDLKDEEQIGSKAARWAGYAQAVKSYSQGSVQSHFVLGHPRKPNLEDSFDRAKKYLEKITGARNVVTEENSSDFADIIEGQMQGH